jgi:hypothetical protein
MQISAEQRRQRAQAFDEFGIFRTFGAGLTRLKHSKAALAL